MTKPRVFPEKMRDPAAPKKRNTPPKINESNLKMVNWKMFFLFRGCSLRFHVDLPGCIPATYTVKTHDFQRVYYFSWAKLFFGTICWIVGRLTGFIQLGFFSVRLLQCSRRSRDGAPAKVERLKCRDGKGAKLSSTVDGKVWAFT